MSYMLIDSELNGFVENPADYFIDSEISAFSKQRLLMLVNGWKGYFWNGVPGIGDNLKFRQKAGLTFRGVATDRISGQPLKNGEITLVIEKDSEMAFLTQTTDERGNFSFSGLLFNDTANVYVQAKNETGRQNTEISLLPAFFAPPSVSVLKALGGMNEMPPDLEIQKYDQDLAWSSLIGRTDISEEPPEKQESAAQFAGDGHYRIYDQADHVIEISGTDVFFSNILDYLTGKVAGLDISGDQVSIRGMGNFDSQSTPLFLVDGIPINSYARSATPLETKEDILNDNIDTRNAALDKIKSIPLQDIDKVEILKSPQNLTMFGMEGANGVIAIYTHHGKFEKPSSTAIGVIQEKINGYSSFRKFYSPKYLPEDTNTALPDFRTTLFWDPEIVVPVNGTVATFFSSDQTGRYRIITEGISESGRICIGSAEFEVVNEENE